MKFHKINSSFYEEKDENVDQGFVFSPKSATLKDDGCHQPKNVFSLEWWYFDAMLDNGYSVEIGFHLYNLFNNQFLKVNIDVYKNGKLQYQEKEIYHPKNVEISSSRPEIVLFRNLFW